MKKTALFLMFLILILGTALQAQTIVTIGHDTTVNTTSGTPTPYGTWYKNFRQQYLYTAAEIENAGGGAGPILSIAFNVQVLNNCSPMPNFTIKMKNTTQTALTTTFEVGDYTTVFAQDNFMPIEGWNTHSLIQPYQWDGSSNILIDLSCTFTDSYTQNASVYYTATTGVNTCLRYQSDSIDASTSATGTVSVNRANIRFNMTAATVTTPPNPATLASPADGATNQSLGTILSWNPGTGLPSGYKVHLGTTNPPPFVQDVGGELSYSPAELQNDTTYYWKIVPYNSLGDATNCPVWSFTTVPDGLVFIGDGTTTGIYLPVNTLYGYSYSQTVYLQSEINVPNQRIEKIAYYWNGGGTGMNNDQWTIYMGHTDEVGFSSTTSWIPGANLTQVFSGTVNFPATAGWMEILFTNPFVYNNTQNLVIGTLETSPGYNNAGSFYNTIAAGRSLRCQSDSVIPDPAAPPTGTMQGHHPNIMLFMGDLPDGPVLSYTPNALDFGLLMQDNPSNWQNLMIVNTGSGTINLSAANFSITGANAAMFEFDPVNLPANLSPGVSVQIPVRATVSVEGEVSAILRINWGGDNYDVALTAQGLPGGMVIIGDGTVTTRYPLGCYFGYERSASLYLADEIGLGNKRINTLAWYATQALTQGIPTTIYLKSYSGNSLSADTWANHILGATPVYSGTDTPVNANEWHAITLDNTFDLDSGDNLLVLVERNHGGSGAGAGSVVPAVYGTTLTGMHHMVQADSNPPTGNTTAQASRPNLMFFADSYEITDPPNPAIVISPQNGATMVSQSPTLSWASGGGGPTGYKLHFGTTNPPPFVADLGGVQSYAASNLEGETTYYWRIIPYNANGEATGCPVWSFETLPDGLVFIGDGTTTGIYLPVNTLWGYSYSQTIYLQNEINISDQRIEKIAYYWPGTGSGVNNNSWTIYMGHTDQSSFSATTDWISGTQLTQVYIGTVDFPTEAGWMEIMLTNPFVYNNTQNLVIGTLEDSPGYTSGGTFLNTIAPGRSLRAYSDSIVPDVNNPPGGASQLLQGHHPNIMMQFGDLPDGPVLSYHPSSIDFGLLIQNNPSEWRNLMITNTGAGVISLNANDISITGANAAMFEFDATNLPVTLGSGISVFIPIRATASIEGDISATLEISWNNNSYEVDLLAEGLPLGVVFIGDGTTGQRQPFGALYGYERSAALYRQDEIVNIGNISMMGWHCSNTGTANLPFKIYLKTTDEETITPTPWDTLISEATLVKDSNHTFDSLDWHTFDLDIPFIYTGGNLMVLVETNYGGSGASGQYPSFFYTSGAAATHLYYNTDNNPPTTNGTNNALRPNLMLHLGELTGDPVFLVSPDEYDYGDVRVGGVRGKDFNIYNAGGGELGITAITISGAADFSLTNLPALPASIESAQGISFRVNYMPATLGVHTATVQITDNLRNIHTVALAGNGVNDITVGNGSQTARMPLDFYYKSSLYETIFTADEISQFAGLITGIKLYSNFSSNLINKPVQLWLGSTQQENLTSGWIPATELTQVFDGTQDFPSGQNEIVFTFDVPYVHPGGNLVFMAKRPLDASYFSSLDYFRTQTGTTGRARNMYSDTIDYDPNAPAAGTATGIYPMITFQALSGGAGSLGGTVTSGATALNGVLIELIDSVFSTHTNASGEYYFPFVLEGDYTLRAHKIGYEDHTQPITIIEDELTTVNINMTESATVQVTGFIDGSDNPGVGLPEADVYLVGPINYQGTTDNTGNFVIPNVLSGNTFNYSIQRAGYQSATGTIVVGSNDYNMGTITLTELTLPPSAVTAELNPAETAVIITWRNPGQGGNVLSYDFEYDDGDWEPSANWGAGSGDWEWTDDYDVANFVDTYGSTSVIPPPAAHSGTGFWGTKINENYTNSGGSNFLSKTFDFSGLSNAQMSFWSWENVFGDFDYCQVLVNGTLVWGPSWDYTNTQWQNRIIDLSAYDGMNEVEITFEMYATTVVNYAGWYIDDIEIGSGDRVATTSPLPVMPKALRGLSETEAAKVAESLAPRSSAPTFTQSKIQSAPHSRIPIGYRVYKLMAGQEQQHNLWEQLTATPITDTTFVHDGWQDLPNGVHKWAVVTVYTGGVLSDPGFSNNLRKWPNDMSALSIQGPPTPAAGSTSNYVITVKNVGTSAQAAGAYTVKIMSGTSELASVPGPAITPGQSLEVTVPWIPISAGAMQIYGKVVLPGDLAPENDNSDPISILVFSTGLLHYTVGAGDQAARNPINMYYKSSISQTMYYPAEIDNFYGFLMGIQYYNSFITNLPQKPIKIYISTTTLPDLSGGFIPADDTHTLVFDGNVDFPTGQNIITFPFNEPYMYLNGENLVVTVLRPLDTAYFSSSDNFLCQTVGSNRNRITQSDTIAYDAASPPATTTLSGQFPMTTFLGIPGGVGTFQGIVNTANNQPLPGVAVALIDAGYAANTMADGSYYIQYVLPGDYQASFSCHGYITQVHDIEIEEDEITTLNITMQLMPQVTVSGSIIASDTSQGIAGANITLSGYENYSGTSTANGTFSIPNVFAGHTYAYVISAEGYTTTVGTVEVGNTDTNMGTLTLNEVAYAPNSVEAEISASYMEVELSWNVPDPNAIEIIEGFESAQFPPAGWSQTITNTSAANNYGVYPTWCSFGAAGNIYPSEGNRQAGLTWIEEHQDEWLYTPSFNCPPDAYMRFDTYATLGSDAGDHYYVKISTDTGISWTALWDASALPEGSNNYNSPITIDLSVYGGRNVILAFHALDPPTNDGLWSDWYIDNIYIGNMVQSLSLSADKAAPERSRRTDALSGVSRSLPGLALQKEKAEHEAPNRALVGYRVWRFTVGQEGNETTWIEITDETHANTSFVDSNWASLPNGAYKWAVKAVYTADVLSAPAYSNALVKDLQNGNIVGFVRDPNNQGIAGAIVSAGGIQTTTSPVGAYSLTLPAGQYEVTAEANDYHPQTQEGIVVAPNQNTTVNFIMIPTSVEDEVIPITITKLNGNYPNPFNPETTISYDIKEACPVNLEIYNLRGQKVRTLVNDTQAMGRYRLVFNARDDRGMPLSSGVYFYRFKAGDYMATRKMLLME